MTVRNLPVTPSSISLLEGFVLSNGHSNLGILGTTTA